RTMPKTQAGTLSASDYNAVLAFILDRNGYPAGDRELTADQNALAALRLTPPTSATPDRKEAPAYLAGTGGTAPKAAGPSHQDLLAATRGRDWLMHEHAYSGTRYSPLTQITSANASRLRVACIYQVGETGNFQTGPIVDRGTMYLTAAYATIAIDATTCRPKWRHVWSTMAPDRPFNNRGVAVKDGRVIRASSDGYL